MDFPKDQRGRGATASRKGRINVEHGVARRPTIPKNHGTRNRLFQTDDTELSRRTGTGGRTFRTPIRQPEKEHRRLRHFHHQPSTAERLQRVCRRGNILYGTPLLRRGGHRHRQTRQLQGSGQSHRRTDRGGKSRGTAERHTEGRERSLRQVGESQVQTQENRR